MPDVYLGPTMSGAPLPPIRWTGGGAPDIPIDWPKGAVKSALANGSSRYHPLSHQPRRWKLAWEMLTAAELADFLTLNGYDQELYFQNNWEDATWRLVSIVGFDYDPAVNIGPSGCRYALAIALEEVS